MRRAVTVLVAVWMAAWWAADLSACGDKFLRIGRSMRYGRYAAAYPATILIYAPKDSVPARVRDLAHVLKRAGHTPTVVTSAAALQDALERGSFDLVLTGLAQADVAVKDAAAAPSRPDVLPMYFEGNAADEAAAASLSSCRIPLPGRHRNDALAEIDHKMELRAAARGR